jgi:hypothetical protein
MNVTQNKECGNVVGLSVYKIYRKLHGVTGFYNL